MLNLPISKFLVALLVGIAQSSDVKIPAVSGRAPLMPPSVVVAPAMPVPAPSAAVTAALPAPAPLSSLAPLSGDQIFSLAKPAVFRISTRLIGVQTEAGHGTGFAIDLNGYLVTNFHVVATALEQPDKYELVVQYSNQSMPAKVEMIDAVNDLALVKVAIQFPAILTIAEQGTGPGEVIFSVGFPQSESLTLAQGNSNGDRVMGFAPVLGATLSLNPGMSGGPCLNQFGKVIGVNRAMLNKAQNISYLSPWRALRALAAKHTTPTRNFDQWRRHVVEQIKTQEMQSAAEMVSVVAPEQKIGRVRFTPPLKLASCGQDDSGQLKLKAFACEGVSLALAGEDSPALQVMTYATQTDSALMGQAFDSALNQNYDRAKKLGAELKTRAPASIPGAQSKAREQCGVQNVLNSHQVLMTVRYCSVALAAFDGLYSTFIKVEINTGGLITRFEQAYSGLTMKTTSAMIELFLESLKVEST